MSAAQLGLLYTGFALTGILMQLCVPLLTKLMTKTVILLLSTLLCFIAMLLTGFTGAFITFGICLCMYGLFNGLRNPMLNAIIADNNNPQRQGEVMGVNYAWTSLGQFFGPISAGLITVISIHSVFFLSAFYILVAFLFTFRLASKSKT